MILTTLGTRVCLELCGITLEPGMKLTFFMDDGDEHGNRDDLIFEGTIERDETAIAG